MRLILQKMLSHFIFPLYFYYLFQFFILFISLHRNIKKRPLYQFSDITALQMLSLLSVLFSISLPHFEIVTKFLRLLCNCMILLSCNNVNIFVAYFLRNYKIYSLLFVTFLVIIVHLRIK